MDRPGLLFRLPLDCDTAMTLVARVLQGAGLILQRTFDLRSACSSLSGPVCPHHGSGACDCQLIIFLVYGLLPPPIALIGYGSSDQAEICLHDLPNQRSHLELADRIRNALHCGT